MHSIKKIETIVKQARNVFEKNKLDIDYIIFKNFPLGACGAASELLGRYLIDKRFNNVECVYGKCNGITHAWLEADGFIIDITIDQFDSTIGPVYFNRSKMFHNRFSNQTRESPEITNFLSNAYHTFYKLLEDVNDLEKV